MAEEKIIGEGVKKPNKKFNIDEIVNALRAEKRGERFKKQIQGILGGSIPDLQWKLALKELKESYTGYKETPLATAKGYIEGLTNTRITKQRKKNKKGGSVKTSKYSKGGGVRSAKYKI
jgi:hypothetical protein